MNPQPKMTVLVPVYQGEGYLRACLQSLVEQTSRSFTVFICDDGSSDSSKDIIKEFTSKFDFIHALSKEGKTQGLFPNLNGLLKKVETPFVRILCQDDVLFPECVESEISFLERYPEVAVAYSPPRVIDFQSNKLEEGGNWKWPNVIRPGLAIQQFYFHGCIPGNLSTVFFRKSAIDRHGMFNPIFKVSGDFDLWSRICEDESLGVLGKRLVSVRRHEKQLSRSHDSILPFLVEDDRIRQRLLRKMPSEKGSAIVFYSLYFFGNARFKLVLDFVRRKKVWLLFKSLFQLGPLTILVDGLVWTLSLGGRILRPRAPFVLTEDEAREHGLALAKSNMTHQV